jgi:hypothetical protein
MKRIFLIILIAGFFFPLVSLAAPRVYTIINDSGAGPPSWSVEYEGFVPCGRCLGLNRPARVGEVGECGTGLPIGAPTFTKFVDCSPCHFFVLIDGIVDFILLTVVPPIATIILIVAGIAFYQAGASPEKFSWAKSVLTATVIGLVIIYLSWVIINFTLDAVGVADWVGFGEGWFQIKCELSVTDWF